MEQFDEVVGGVGEQDLPAAGSGDRFAAERQAGSLEPVDLGVEVVDDEVDAVAAGAGGVVRGGAGAAAGRSGQQQSRTARVWSRPGLLRFGGEDGQQMPHADVDVGGNPQEGGVVLAGAGCGGVGDAPVQPTSRPAGLPRSGQTSRALSQRVKT
ncbi:hypothetical protein OG271_30335 [Micromonospora rifamycinica]|uniref:hypothetical protein n=1 Tax=Micromonospora rifamycinica TaxID=291594 RepID=UPI002E2B7B3D|nr:hypothetical protein [Micromonospora rifamycinica]